MSQPQIIIREMSFNAATSFDKVLFKELNLVFSKKKIGLIGKNGVGKSTLLKLIINELTPKAGSIQILGTIAYVPQILNQLTQISVASFLGCAEKINALHRITLGSVDEKDFEVLNEDWEIEDFLQQQLALFGLQAIEFNRPLTTLSGGELTRLMLTKAFSSNVDFILLDEPTNHLDMITIDALIESLRLFQGGIVLVSHDRHMIGSLESQLWTVRKGRLIRYENSFETYLEELAEYQF